MMNSRLMISVLPEHLFKRATAMSASYQHTSVGNQQHSVAFLEQDVRLVRRGKSKPSFYRAKCEGTTHFLSVSSIRVIISTRVGNDSHSHRSQLSDIGTMSSVCY